LKNKLLSCRRDASAAKASNEILKVKASVFPKSQVKTDAKLSLIQNKYRGDMKNSARVLDKMLLPEGWKCQSKSEIDYSMKMEISFDIEFVSIKIHD
jgi:hypothetical protein